MRFKLGKIGVRQIKNADLRAWIPIASSLAAEATMTTTTATSIPPAGKDVIKMTK